MTLTVKTLLSRSHDIQHVIDIPGWRGTKDLQLYAKAQEAGFQLIVTNDAKQMNRRSEVEAIASSGLHRVQYPHRQDGLTGLGLAMAAVCAALPSVLQELVAADGQRLVTLRAIDPGSDRRYAVRDPASDPPRFWPRGGALRPCTESVARRSVRAGQGPPPWRGRRRGTRRSWPGRRYPAAASRRARPSPR
jgi:hypothetical protein